jgi:hypothetical protein
MGPSWAAALGAGLTSLIAMPSANVFVASQTSDFKANAAANQAGTQAAAAPQTQAPAAAAPGDRAADQQQRQG